MQLPGILQAASNIVMSGGDKTFFGRASQGASAPWQVQIFIVVFLIIGLVQLFFPRVAWWLKVGWQFREAPEPSGLWLFFARFGGFLIAVIAFLVLLGMNGVKVPLPMAK